MVGSHPRLPIPPQAHRSRPARTKRRLSSYANGKRFMMANGKSSANSNQHARFVETARALGCDESEEAFDEKLKVITRHKPKDSPTERPAPKRRGKAS